MGKLIGVNYANDSFQVLARHENYSPKAMRVVGRIMLMTTEELEALDQVIGEK